MRTGIKVLVLALFVLVVLAAGELVLIDVFNNSFTLNSTNPSSSVVYVQNGVSGTVTITDPSLNKTVDMNVEYYITSGSGVIVTSNGYIITAFHVIGDPQTLENQQKLKLMSSSDINYYVEQAAVTEYVSKYNPQLARQISGNGNSQIKTADLTNLFIQNNLIKVDSSKQVIKVKTTSSNYLDAQLVDIGNPNDDEDVALLKVNRNNLPALFVSSNNPSTGKNVRIFGYPAGNGNTISLASSNGTVTGKIANNQGIIYYETNAHTTNGYSGGPALDNNNNVLGIVIYAIQSRGHFKSGTNAFYSLFLSSDYLIKICRKNNVPINIS